MLRVLDPFRLTLHIENLRLIVRVKVERIKIMLRYLVCEDRAHRAFLRLMVLDDLFNTFFPEIPTSSFYVTSLWDNIRVRLFFKHLT